MLRFIKEVYFSSAERGIDLIRSLERLRAESPVHRNAYIHTVSADKPYSVYT